MYNKKVDLIIRNVLSIPALFVIISLSLSPILWLKLNFSHDTTYILVIMLGIMVTLLLIYELIVPRTYYQKFFYITIYCTVLIYSVLHAENLGSELYVKLWPVLSLLFSLLFIYPLTDVYDDIPLEKKWKWQVGFPGLLSLKTLGLKSVMIIFSIILLIIILWFIIIIINVASRAIL